MPRKVPKPLTNKNRATENRKNYLRARNASRSRSRVKKKDPMTGLARNANDFYETEIDPRLTAHSCGALDIVCQHCNALRWIGEKNTFCCQDDKVRIEIPPPPPLHPHNL